MTDVANAAPGSVDSAVAPTAPVAPAVTSAPEISVSDAARAIANRRWEAERKRNEQPSSEAAPAEELPQGNAAPETDPGETQAQAPEPAESPPIEPPRSWTTEEKERFKNLPREMQAYLAEREQERDRDLRRRQNEAADARKAIDAEREATTKARQDYEAAVANALQLAQTQAAGEFSDVRTWDDVRRMASEDPIRFNQWQAHQQKMQSLSSEASAAQQRQQQESSQKWQSFAAEQDKLFTEKVPEFADPAKATKLREGAVKTLKEIGFTDQELAAGWNGQQGVSFRDHRLQLLILDGVKYRDAQAAAKSVTATPKPPVQRPGTAQPRSTGLDAQIQALQQQLTQTGSPKIAAQLITLKREAAAKRR